MGYFDVILLGDVIVLIGPKISDCDTSYSSFVAKCIGTITENWKNRPV